MSRDIVERLNDPVARAAWANAEMFEEAADEIIRLRAELAADRGKLAKAVKLLEGAKENDVGLELIDEIDALLKEIEG